MKKQLDIKKLLLLNMPYILMGLFATNFGEAWRMAVGADASAKMLSFFSTLPVALASWWPSLHLLDLLLGISGGIGSVWTAIDASPSGLMQFLQAAFWLPELLTVIGVWSAAGACRSRGAQISTGGLNCLRTAAVFRIIFEALELTFLLIYLLFYSAEDFFSFHFVGEEYVVFVMAGGCALTIVLQGCIIAALNSANEAAVKARATTLPPMLLAVIVMAEAAMQIIGLAMYWGAPYLDYDIALQLYGMFGYLTGSVLLHMLSLLFSAVSGILFSVVTLRYRREVSAAMEAE